LESFEKINKNGTMKNATATIQTKGARSLPEST